MSSIYVELKAKNTSRTVDGSMKSGNTYIIYVNETFDSKNSNNLSNLVDELNYQLNKEGIEKIELRKIERELNRLEIGKRVDIRI